MVKTIKRPSQKTKAHHEISLSDFQKQFYGYMHKTFNPQRIETRHKNYFNAETKKRPSQKTNTQNQITNDLHIKPPHKSENVANCTNCMVCFFMLFFYTGIPIYNIQWDLVIMVPLGSQTFNLYIRFSFIQQQILMDKRRLALTHIDLFIRFMSYVCFHKQ